MSNGQREAEDAKSNEKRAKAGTILFAKDSVTVLYGSHSADADYEPIAFSAMTTLGS